MEDMLPVAAVLLAGGESRRMGTDKRTLAHCGGKTLLTHAAGQIRWAAERYLSVGAVPTELAGFTTVPDLSPGRGPVGGLVSCLGRTKLEWAIALPCDMPGLTAEALRALFCLRRDGVDGVCLTLGGRAKAFPILLRVAAALPVLEAGLREERLALFRLLREGLALAEHPAEELPEFTPTLLDNLNEPGDYARFREGTKT